MSHIKLCMPRSAALNSLDETTVAGGLIGSITRKVLEAHGITAVIDPYNAPAEIRNVWCAYMQVANSVSDR